MEKSGEIVFIRNNGLIYVPFLSVVSLSEVQAFASALSQYSNAGVTKAAYITAEDMTILENPEPGPLDAYKAVIQLKRTTDPGSSGRFREVHIPAPKSEIFTVIDGKRRVLDNVANDVAELYSTLTGVEYVKRKSWLSE